MGGLKRWVEKMSGGKVGDKWLAILHYIFERLSTSHLLDQPITISFNSIHPLFTYYYPTLFPLSHPLTTHQPSTHHPPTIHPLSTHHPPTIHSPSTHHATIHPLSTHHPPTIHPPCHHPPTIHPPSTHHPPTQSHRAICLSEDLTKPVVMSQSFFRKTTFEALLPWCPVPSCVVVVVVVVAVVVLLLLWLLWLLLL